MWWPKLEPDRESHIPAAIQAPSCKSTMAIAPQDPGKAAGKAAQGVLLLVPGATNICARLCHAICGMCTTGWLFLLQSMEFNYCMV